MPGFTTRLGLSKPGGGSTGTIADEVVDIDVLNGDLDKIDAAVGIKRASSTTRPSTPFDGQLIRESDTKRTLFWDPSISGWVEITPNTPILGRVTKSNADAAYTVVNSWVGAQANIGWDPIVSEGPISGFLSWDGSNWKALVAGLFEFTYTLSGETSGAGVLIAVTKNTTTGYTDASVVEEITGGTVAGRAAVTVSRKIRLAANDTISAYVYNPAAWTVKAVRREGTFTQFAYLGA